MYTDLTREQVEYTLERLTHDTNTDYNVGMLTAMHSLTADAELQDELLVAIVYQQTIKYETQANEISALSQGVAQVLEVGQVQLQAAGEKVYAIIQEQQKGRGVAANETQSDDSN